MRTIISIEMLMPCLRTAYFQFDLDIYNQVEDLVKVSPLYHMIVNTNKKSLKMILQVTLC